VTRQFQGIALEGPGIAPSPGGKIDLDLTQNPTNQTQDPLDRQFNPNGLGAYGKRAESAHYQTPALNLMGAAFRTAEGKDLLLYPKVDSPIMIFAVNMLVSLNAEAMIK